jgi:Raf kinase inhibitor-like YbhB/YbcL family protein
LKKSAKQRLLLLGTLVLAAIVAALFLTRRGTSDIVVDSSVGRVGVTSGAFQDMAVIPGQYTGRGADISPELILSGLSGQAVSIAVIMEDLDIPWSPGFAHWLIWDIPAQAVIPEAVPPGDAVPSLGGARQGNAFGKNRYRGPMPPFGSHRYQYHVFVLDSMLGLDASADKAALLAAMEGHILQYGSLTGWYPSAG